MDKNRYFWKILNVCEYQVVQKTCDDIFNFYKIIVKVSLSNFRTTFQHIFCSAFRSPVFVDSWCSCATVYHNGHLNFTTSVIT